MLITALRAKIIECCIQLVKVILILPTRSPRLHNMLRQRLRILGSEKLGIIGKADVDKALYRLATVRGDAGGEVHVLVCGGHVVGFLFGGGGLDEGDILHAVAVDFADVHVLAHFGDFRGGDAVGCAPGFGGC